MSDHATSQALATGPSHAGSLGGLRIPVLAGTVAVLVAILYLLLLGSAVHAPTPHELPVAVSAPAQVGTQLAGGAGADTFSPNPYADLAAVERAVRRNDVVGGLALDGRRATIVVAGAQGAGTSQVVSGAFGTMAETLGLAVTTVDVAPLPANDSMGASGFVTVVGVTIASTIFAVIVTILGRRMRVGTVVAAIIAYSLVVGVCAALIMDTAIDTLTGHFLALAGIATLLAVAVSTTIIALGRLLGLGGIGLGALLVVIMGVSTSGSVIGYRFLPAFHRALSPWLLTGPALEAIRDAVYFQGDHAARGIIVLLSWTLVAGVLLLATSSTRRTQVA